MTDWFVLLTVALGVWRFTHMLIEEEGPYSVFSRFRYYIGERRTNQGTFEYHTRFAKGFNCFYCSSIWWSFLFIGLYCLWPRFLYLYIVLAVSAISIFIEELVVGDK